MRKQIIYCKVKHKGTIYDACMCLGDKEINIHPKGKRTKITDFEIIKDSVVSLGYSNDY